MAGSLNKKVLCFIDEYGTAGQGDLYFGAVISLSRENGRIDKSFSDQLESNANEIHAVKMNDDYLKDLMLRFWKSSPQDCFVLINRKISIRDGSPPILYAQGLVETVKIGLKLFKKDILKSENINNVEIITDINHHNKHSDFDIEISRSQSEEGLFRAVTHVSKIDSAASRMLQLADIAAYSRKYIINQDIRAEQLYQRYGIQIR